MLFSPAPMRGVNLYVCAEEVERTAVALARLRRFHIHPLRADGWSDPSPEWEDLRQRLADQRQRFDALLEDLGVDRRATPPPRRLIPGEDAEDVSGGLREAEAAVGDWRDRKRRVEGEVEHLRYLIEEVSFIEHLRMPVEEIRNPAYLHWVVGTMDREKLDTLQFALFGPGGDRSGRARGRRRPSMRKVNIFVDESTVAPAALSLMLLSEFRFVESRGEGWSRASDRWGGLGREYADLTDRLERLLEVLSIPRPEVGPDERAAPLTDADGIRDALERLEPEVNTWESRRREARETVDRLRSLRRGLAVLAPLAIPLSAMRNPAYLSWSVGILPRERMERFRVVLFRIPAVVMPIPCPDHGDRVLILTATDRSHAHLISEIMGELHGETIPLPEGYEGTPDEALRSLESDTADARAALDDLDRAGERLANRRRQQLLTLWRRASTDARAAEAVTRFARHGHDFLISGWIPGENVTEMVTALETAARGRAEIEVVEPPSEKAGSAVSLMLFRIPLILIPVAVKGDRLLVVAATDRRHADILDRALAGVFIDPLPLPEDVRGIPSEVLPELKQRLARAQEALSDLDRERRRLARHWTRRLLALRRVAESGYRIASAVTRLPHRKGTFLIPGWVPEPAVPDLMAAVETTTGGRADVELVSPAAGGRRNPPSLMRNLRIFRPFEAMVRTFGSPGYDEIDPTPVAALFFVLMYGMMFGDVGHGLLLMLLGGALAYRGRGMISSLGAVLGAAGAGGVAFGFLYGSLFGREDLLPARWLRPLENMVDLLLAAVAGGVVILLLGFAAALVNSFRTRRWGDLLFGGSGIAGVWLYAGLVGGGTAAALEMISPSTLPVLLAPPAVLLVFREPLGRLVHGRRPLMEGDTGTSVVQGLFELFETVLSDISNTLSFVRLGAFAVAHAGFMKVIFTLAEGAGPVARWAILVVGTALVVGFEGLVVGIQALRLEYYEFFGKFFSGRGVAFRPFHL